MHGQEVEQLRVRAALQEAKLIAEKSMIGRLHNQLADMNFRKLRWEEDLDATTAQLAAAQAQAGAKKLQTCLCLCFTRDLCRDGTFDAAPEQLTVARPHAWKEIRSVCLCCGL